MIDRLERLGIDSLWFSELVYSKAVDPFVGMASTPWPATRRLKVGTRWWCCQGAIPCWLPSNWRRWPHWRRGAYSPSSDCGRPSPPNANSSWYRTGQRAAMFDESLRASEVQPRSDGTTFAGDYLHRHSVDGCTPPCQTARHLARRLRARRICAHRPLRRRLARQIPHAGRGTSRTRVDRACRGERGPRHRTRPLRHQPRSERRRALRRPGGRRPTTTARRRPRRPRGRRMGHVAPQNRRVRRRRADEVRRATRRTRRPRGFHRPVRRRIATAGELIPSASPRQ